MDQLGCQVNQTASARIITANGATKTPIGEINDFPFECASIAARNCRQWMHAMAMTKNIRQQPSSIVMHVSLNALEDQNKWENEIIHYV
ncbi:hypothetical protein G9A89_001482 [Geosiphon pyriformis]|nr:hypothetical protein G9A89_001482 [Geosiphon pyriformis]